jgi:deoxyadenosine/deoxycytidine kinase
MSSPKIISIEGGIGAGKTTIIEHLETIYKNDATLKFIREPVSIWESIQDDNGENILQKFYKDSEKYAFTFQVMAFVTRLSMIRKIVKENPECKMIICERSLDADRNIFAKMLFDDGLIDDIHYKIYLKFYEEYKDDFKLDGIVYINADAEVCSSRIQKRARGGEESVPLEYLKNCQKYHDEWLDSLPEGMVLNIKTNEDVSYNGDRGTVWLEEIQKYINEVLNKDKNVFDIFECFMEENGLIH